MDFDSLPQSSQQIVYYKGDYLLGYYQTCKDLQSQCSGILKLSKEGEIIDKVLLEKFSNNPNSILIDENKIFLTGEDYFTLDTDGISYKINEIETNSLDSINNYYFSDPLNPFINMFQIVNAKWNDKIVLSGSGSIPNDNNGNRGLIFVLNKDF